MKTPNDPPLTNADLKRMWSDSANWRWWCYHCYSDLRLFVPKRMLGMGWAINAAHGRAFFALFALICLSLLPPIGVIIAEGLTPGVFEMFAAVLASALLVCGGAAYLARMPSK